MRLSANPVAQVPVSDAIFFREFLKRLPSEIRVKPAVGNAPDIDNGVDAGLLQYADELIYRGIPVANSITFFLMSILCHRGRPRERAKFTILKKMQVIFSDRLSFIVVSFFIVHSRSGCGKSRL